MRAIQVNRISMLSVLITLLLPVLAGCAATATPKIDSAFGDAVNAAKAQQTMHPEASLNTEPVNGLDGEAANAAMDRYHRSFERPPITGNIFNIGVGSGVGAGGGATGAATGAGTGATR